MAKKTKTKTEVEEPQFQEEVYRTQNSCEANCYEPYDSVDCEIVTDDNLFTAGTDELRYYSYNLAQQVSITDKADIDSQYM